MHIRINVNNTVIIIYIYIYIYILQCNPTVNPQQLLPTTNTHPPGPQSGRGRRPQTRKTSSSPPPYDCRPSPPPPSSPVSPPTSTSPVTGSIWTLLWSDAVVHPQADGSYPLNGISRQVQLDGPTPHTRGVRWQISSTEGHHVQLRVLMKTGPNTEKRGYSSTSAPPAHAVRQNWKRRIYMQSNRGERYLSSLKVSWLGKPLQVAVSLPSCKLHTTRTDLATADTCWVRVGYQNRNCTCTCALRGLTSELQVLLSKPATHSEPLHNFETQMMILSETWRSDESWGWAQAGWGATAQ